MAYKINGTTITLQPTVGRWIPKGSFGTDGNGHEVYPMYREFEMRWQLISATDAFQIQDFFDSLIITGSVIIDLPKYKSSTYVFESYTGCILHEPQMEDFYQEHRTNMVLLVTNIRTP